MEEFIMVKYEGEKPTVNGRELHEALEISTEYRHWFPRMCEFGFTEGKDFRSILNESTGGRPGIDHEITLSMAKELCMIQRSEKGRQFRKYFIQCEEAWNSPDKIMERAFHIAHNRAIEAERKIFGLMEENETLEIALNESLKFFTVAKYNNVFNKGWSLKQCQDIGKQLSAYCRSHSIEIRKCETNDERFGSVNSYPITVWEDFIEYN